MNTIMNVLKVIIINKERKNTKVKAQHLLYHRGSLADIVISKVEAEGSKNIIQK